jgi:hypothetical protein
MKKLLLWVLLLGVNALLLWQLGLGEPSLPPVLVGGLIVVVNLIVGIGVGHSFAQAYLDDMGRLNRSLVDQNSELVQCNRELLAQVEGGASRAPLREEQSA